MREKSDADGGGVRGHKGRFGTYRTSPLSDIKNFNILAPGVGRWALVGGCCSRETRNVF